MEFIKEDDSILYGVFEKILLEKRVNFSSRIITEEHGAMAGLPIAPFFANIYYSFILFVRTPVYKGQHFFIKIQRKTAHNVRADAFKSY